MENTLDPQVIYEAFAGRGFPVQRIDQFDRGDYAEVRVDLNYTHFLTVSQLQEITMKLGIIEKHENVQLQIVNIDMSHQSMRVNIKIGETI
jgi:hypothetical protein